MRISLLYFRYCCVSTYHEYRTVYLSSVQKRSPGEDDSRIYMFRNNFHFKNNIQNLQKAILKFVVDRNAAVNLFQVELDVTCDAVDGKGHPLHEGAGSET